MEFHINDDALGTTQAGSATVTDVSAGTKYINLATEMAGADSDTATSTTIDFGEGNTYTGVGHPLGDGSSGYQGQGEFRPFD